MKEINKATIIFYCEKYDRSYVQNAMSSILTEKKVGKSFLLQVVLKLTFEG